MSDETGEHELVQWLQSAARALQLSATSPADRKRIVGEIRRRLEAHDAPAPAWELPMPIAHDEWSKARLAPRCIVEHYIYADVAVLIAPGATGKTTMTLYEAAHIVLGLPLWGLPVITPGPVLIVTAEDRREYLVARLREICKALSLSDAQRLKVQQRVRIDDRTRALRRLTTVVGEAVTPSAFANEIVAGCNEAEFAPVLVQFDPMVSFGVGEARVNDAEQGLIEAARIITGALDCCVRYTHHSGKANARDRAVDQYAGRGGSALPDGCRLVHVLQTLDAGEVAKLCGYDLGDDESAFALHRPKLSYSPPRQPTIYVRRSGYTFRLLTAAAPPSDEQRLTTDADQVLRFLAAEVANGARHSRATLEDTRPDNLPRSRFRAAVGYLLSRGRIEEAPVEPPPARGARTYLRPTRRGEATANRGGAGD